MSITYSGCPAHAQRTLWSLQLTPEGSYQGIAFRHTASIARPCERCFSPA